MSTYSLFFLLLILWIFKFQNFSRVNADGTPVDANTTDFQMKGPFNNVIHPKNIDATLKVWPEEVENAGQVTVLWEGIKDPLKGDRIGYYCPFYDKPNHYLDYIDVTKSPTWQQGYGYYTLTLYNMRQPCAFRYYSNNTLVAISNKVRFTNGDAYSPLHVHLATTNNPTEMKVMWVAAKGIDCIVFYFL